MYMNKYDKYADGVSNDNTESNTLCSQPYCFL